MAGSMALVSDGARGLGADARRRESIEMKNNEIITRRGEQRQRKRSRSGGSWGVVDGGEDTAQEGKRMFMRELTYTEARSTWFVWESCMGRTG